MKVILLADIPKVGNRYDVKDLKVGYAQNVLISKGLAIVATPAELAKLADKKAKSEKQKEEEEKAFESLINSIDNKTVTIYAKANEKGHLFKSVSPNDVVEAVKESTGVIIDPHSIVMDHVKELGIHTIAIKKGRREGKCKIIIAAKK